MNILRQSSRGTQLIFIGGICLGISSVNIHTKPQLNSYCSPSSSVHQSRRKMSMLVETEELSVLRPSTSTHDRMDEVMLSKPEYEAIVRDHVIYANLMKPQGIEAYEVYKDRNTKDITCLVKFGTSLNGYPGVVHGGITALMFDNTYGFVLVTAKTGPAFTANLSVNYKKPILPDTYGIITARVSSMDDRKIYMEATLSNPEGELLANSTALFIKMKQEANPELHLQSTKLIGE